MSSFQVAACLLDQFGGRNYERIVEKIETTKVGFKNLTLFREIGSQNLNIHVQKAFEKVSMPKDGQKKLIETINLLKDACIEMLTEAKGKKYTLLQKKYCPLGASEDDFRETVVRLSLKVLAFPMWTLVSPNCNIEALNAIELERKKNITLSNPSERFFFAEAAFRYKNEVIYFSDLWRIWDCESQVSFYNKSQGKDWIDNHSLFDLEAFQKCNKETFESFVKDCSILAFSDNLLISMSKELKDLFRKLFCDESIRSDLLFFSSDGKDFVSKAALDARKSKPYVKAIQCFLQVTKNAELKLEERGYLFEMMFSQSELEDVEGLENVKTVLEKFQTLHQPFLFGPFSYPLFVYFCKSPSGCDLAELFISFINHQSFLVSIETIYNFCQKNLSNNFHRHLLTFRSQFFSILEKLKNKGVEIKNAEKLFLSPPVKIGKDFGEILNLIEDFIDQMSIGKLSDNEYISVLKSLFVDQGDYLKTLGFDEVKSRIKEFFSRIEKYKKFFHGQYPSMLKRYIQNRNVLVFDILDSMPDNFLEREVVYKALLESNPQFSFPNKHGFKSLQLAETIKEKYALSKVQSFFLYLEFMTLLASKKEKVIAELIGIVSRLNQFCPLLEKEVIFQIVSSGIKIESILLDQFDDLRKRRASKEEVLDKIDKFISLFNASNFKITEKEVFELQLKQDLFSAFFPPLQPLDDYCKVSFKENGEIQWIDTHCSTHVGQLKPVLGKASLAVYLNWVHQNGIHYLFVSFFDEKKGSGRSSFIRVNNIETDREMIRLVYQNLFYETVNQEYNLETLDIRNIASEGNIFPRSGVKVFGEMTLLPEMLQFPNRKAPFFDSDVSVEKIENFRKLIGCELKNREINYFPSEMQLALADRQSEQLEYAIELIEGTEIFRIYLKLADRVVPLQYSVNLVGNEALFSQRFRLHTLYLKALIYHSMKE